MIKKLIKAETVDEFRPIALLDICYKVYASLLNSRVWKYLNKNEPPSQAGFRKGYSVDDYLLALTLLLERVYEFNLQFWAVSLDLSKAFDRVDWNNLWSALEFQHLPQYLIHVLRVIHSNQISIVRANTNNINFNFAIKRNVKQSCLPSPDLLHAILESVMQKWQAQIQHLSIGSNIYDHHLSNLRFAPDILLFSISQEDAIVCSRY